MSTFEEQEMEISKALAINEQSSDDEILVALFAIQKASHRNFWAGRGYKTGPHLRMDMLATFLVEIATPICKTEKTKQALAKAKDAVYWAIYEN